MIAEQMSPDQGIDIPPELQEAYDRVVLAGMKIMFSEKGNKLVVDQLKAEGPLGQKIGKGVASLVLMVFKISNETVPLEVLIPAGIKLVSEAADFVSKVTEQPVPEPEMGVAMETLIMTLLEKFGVDPAQMEQMLNQFDDTAVDQQLAGGAPAPAEQPMPGGVA
jgi:hypothetical protein